MSEKVRINIDYYPEERRYVVTSEDDSATIELSGASYLRVFAEGGSYFGTIGSRKIDPSDIDFYKNEENYDYVIIAMRKPKNDCIN